MVGIKEMMNRKIEMGAFTLEGGSGGRVENVKDDDEKHD